MIHVVLETESQHLICRHCGSTQRLEVPATLTAVAAVMTAFADRHEACPKPEVLPVVKAPRPAPITTTQALFAWPGLAAWLDEGERGVSSETIVEAITGIALGDHADVPHDVSDFHRCVALLERVPSLLPCFAQVAAIDARWARLVSEWPRLEALLRRTDADRVTLCNWLGRNATKQGRRA